MSLQFSYKLTERRHRSDEDGIIKFMVWLSNYLNICTFQKDLPAQTPNGLICNYRKRTLWIWIRAACSYWWMIIDWRSGSVPTNPYLDSWTPMINYYSYKMLFLNILFGCHCFAAFQKWALSVGELSLCCWWNITDVADTGEKIFPPAHRVFK